MADTKTTLTWLLRDQVSGPAKGIEKALGNVEKKGGGIGSTLGSALGGIVNPATLAVAGIGAVAGGLTLAMKAAADEQINVEKMNAALKASVPNWKGNTDSIEKLIAKREDLGFSDDDLRNSMATLVTSTHDVKEAQELQATAMDLARLKGVDLQTASEALAKANNGSTKELKALGISVDDSADKTQVLAAIQQAAAGQATAYAKTTSGKWETLNHKFGDVVETIGGAMLPIMNGLLDFAVNNLIPAIQQIADVVGPALSVAFDIAGKAIGVFIDIVIKPALVVLGTLVDLIKGAISFFNDLFDSQSKESKYVQGGGVGKYGKAPTRRAAGGPVSAGGAYLVGEEGPELLVMGRGGGNIVPNGGGGWGGGVPVSIPIVLDSREIARVVDRNLYYLSRSAPPSRIRS